MTGNEIRQKYLEFFQQRGHLVIPGAPLVLDNDPTTLFTSSGMQPLVPFLKGEAHPMGTRLVDSQPCFRAEDIEEVGDNRHTTFFEMLGNWSLGDYFKKEQLTWFFDFLIKEVHLDPTRLHVTLFKGDEYAPRDSESELIWKEQFNQIQKPFHDIGVNDITVNKNPEKGIRKSDRIFYYEAKKNWWSRAGVPENMPAGEIGGPDSEVFFDFDPNGLKEIHTNSPWKDLPCHPNCDCGRFLEIGNSVFMQYIKQEDGFFTELPKQNVDFGGGLERITAAANDNPDVFTTSLFTPIIAAIESETGKSYSDPAVKPPMRVIADHLKAAVFFIAQGIVPANKLQGYFLRRLLRRAMVKLQQLQGGLNADISNLNFEPIIQAVINIYGHSYFDKSQTLPVLVEEQKRFSKTLTKGLRVIEKTSENDLTGKFAFDLYQTYGFPLEVTEELVKEKGITLDRAIFREEFKKHQELSRTSAKGMFKGGLADHSETITKYHTATHLLHQSLRKILGNHVEQMGSNITNERLRFDFKHPAKLTPEEIQAVEAMVNEQIQANLPVHKTIESKDEALHSGALAFFREKYPEKVSVFTIGKNQDNGWFSKELCGGPHVASTGEIGAVTIKKEEAVGAGVRRIYMVLRGNPVS